MTTRSNRITKLLLCTALSGAGLTAFAQDTETEDASARTLSTVTVTAERREASAQDVPVSVQAFDSAALEKGGVTSLQSLQVVSPSLVITDNTGFVNPFIRGTGSSVVGNGVYSSVATYVDGVYVSRMTSGNFDLDNVESVQVLAGPQGALYGRNATAGAIVVTTKTPRPGDEMSGQISASLGDYNSQSLSGNVSGSLSDQWAFSLNATKSTRDGFIENINPAGFGVNQDDLDDKDIYSIGGALTFEPNEKFSATLRGSYFEKDDRTGSSYNAVGTDVIPGLIPGLNSNQTAIAAVAGQLFMDPALGGAVGASAVFETDLHANYDGFSSAVTNGTGNFQNKPGGSVYVTQQTFSLNAEYDFGSFVGKSITSIGESEYDGATSISVEGPGLGFSPAPGVFAPVTGGIGFTGSFPSETFSQEFQISSADSSNIDWIAGVYYFTEDGKTDLTGDFFGTSLWSARNDYDVESTAVFAQATVPLTDRFSATGGLRFTDETFSLDDRTDLTDPFTFPGSVNVGSLSQSDDNLTYTARVQYDAGDWLAYVGTNTGFKSGALNVNNPAAGSANAEEITSYEAGLKTDLASNVRFNVAGFFYEYDNIQQNVIDSITGATFLINGGNAEVTGVEAELLFVPADGLTLRAAATLLDAEAKSDGVLSTSAVLPTAGKKLPGAADTSINLGVNWIVPFITTGELVANADYAYSSGYFYDPENRIGTSGASDGSFNVVNLNLAYTTPGEAWEFSVWANNASDEEYYRAGVVAAGFALLGTPAAPAHYGATAKFKF